MDSVYRYSGLTFAFLRLESYIGWYQHLLEDSVGHKVCIENININNCIGTVLALNGTRKYYYIYQPKKARKWIRQNNRNMPSAIGMFDSDENSDSDQDSRVILVEELLDGLLDWFDKVFDGSQRKLRITAWPDLRAVWCSRGYLGRYLDPTLYLSHCVHVCVCIHVVVFFCLPQAVFLCDLFNPLLCFFCTMVWKTLCMQQYWILCFIKFQIVPLRKRFPFFSFIFKIYNM